jgi:hypothetical protein
LYVHRNEFRLVLDPPRCASFDPADEHLVILAVLLQPQAAAVRDLGGGFEQDQAPLGSGGKDAAAAGLLRQGRMVKIGVECQQR